MDEDDRCEQCGSTDFLVEDDGRTYCENGHDQGRAPVTGEDELDFARQGRVLKKKEAKEKQKVSAVLHGAKAYQLYLQSWQLILRKQCYALVHHKGLPPELWTIVKDLWMLWLSRLDHRLHDPAESQGRTDPASEADPATTSANETDTDTDVEIDERRRSRKKRDPLHSGPMLIDTAALNYLGVLLLRRPIGLATMLKWIEQEDIPFVRAIRHVPAEMKGRLPGEYRLSLDTMRLLERDDFQVAVYRVAKMYSMSFGMMMPPLNQHLLLFSHVRSLALPIEVYSLAQRLNAITAYRFCYPDTTAYRTTRRQPTTYPEAQLISLIVVATKLLFPFDAQTVKRYPKDPNDPTTLRMDWAVWLKAKQGFDKATTESINAASGGVDRLKPGSEIHTKDSDILNMTDRQLDQYMDWYQRTWIDNISHQHTQSQSKSQENTLDKEILDMFPLHDLPEHPRTREDDEKVAAEEQSRLSARLREVQASLASRRAVSSEEEAQRGLELLRPGAMYLQIRNLEDLAHTDEPVKVFHEEAAHTACLSVKALLRAVNYSEERIDQWLMAQRREEVWRKDEGDGGEGEDEDHDDDNDKVLEEQGKEETHQQIASEDEDAESGVPMVLATSPPTATATASASGTLARDLSGLDIQSSPVPNNGPSSDEEMEMEMEMQT
ncbi:hypothetical protein A1O1_03924 [Capronia coronata CBS 617.96]|uniref:Uncharacterized protein n=1 Tax=Capronia coronata CBS 617.96 TaxID=1182541 RepID=W9Z8H4_9EURO|nr:uncharacterized protein A1O1_03924 [Capronia coronata CBS 617.96]EXJ90819.1 hypothetical protein A1O1_03924 [Capronia coronata CBS 617.96]